MRLAWASEPGQMGLGVTAEAGPPKPRLSAGLASLYLAQAFPVTLVVGGEGPLRTTLGMLSAELEVGG